MAAQAAEERIRQDGEASAYDVDDIRTMTEEAENLFKEPCCENIHTNAGDHGCSQSESVENAGKRQY